MVGSPKRNQGSPKRGVHVTLPRGAVGGPSSPGRTFSRTASLASHKGAWKFSSEQLRNEIVGSGHDVDRNEHARRHYNQHLAGEHSSWDYLKGGKDTPAGAHMYYVDEKKNWKPKWKHKRTEDAINPYAVREENEQRITTAKMGAAMKRTSRLESWNERNNFNPISHQTRNPRTGQWQEATDGWQHQRLHTTNKQVPSQVAIAQEETTMKRACATTTLRTRRLATEGFTGTQRPNTMKQLLQWDT